MEATEAIVAIETMEAMVKAMEATERVTHG